MKIFSNATTPNIAKMFVELNAEYFNSEIPSIPVIWNSRMTTTAGYCRYKREFCGNKIPTRIDLSLKLFKSNDFPEDEIRETLIHEMVHAYLLHKHNESGHGWRFQAMMTEITGVRKNHRCHSYDTGGVKRAAKWAVTCAKCGYSHPYKRKPKYGVYTHRKCGGSMTVSRVESPTEEASSIKIF